MGSRYSWWQICLIAFTLCAASVIPILALRGQFDLRSSPAFSDWVAVASVVVSWPVAIALISLRFMSKFGAAIDSYLRGLGRIKLPGGVELQSSQSSATPESGDIAPDNLVLSPEDQAQIRAAIQDIEQQRDLSVEQRASLEQDFKQMADIAIQWKFQYLSLFFVPITKNVLLWFSKSAPQTRASYESTWSLPIPDQAQRDTILNVLLHNTMINEIDGVLRATPHGYSFLQFVGLIPPTPPPAG